MEDNVVELNPPAITFASKMNEVEEKIKAIYAPLLSE